MQAIKSAIAAVIDHVSEIVMFPLGPRNRIYWLYLISSVIAAFCVYCALKKKHDHATERDAAAASGSFLQFLFPKSVWSHPSAWLDLRYAFFHKIVMHSLILGLTAFATAIGYRWASGGQSLKQVLEQSNQLKTQDWFVASAFMFVSMFILDFIAWFMHYLQHKVPVLWQFHKVHHSSEVMHPISNYREHPVDNLAYGVTTGLGYGLIYALAVRFLGFIPTVPTLLGIPLLMFFFNLVAYNLRHSHVWLRWPGIWSIVFPSPAHHHVHHSRHPDHIDKNFAFMFPLWDVFFGTYHMPKDNRDVEFGVTEGDDRDLDSVFRLYWVPFRDAFRVLRGRKKNPALPSDDVENTQQ